MRWNQEQPHQCPGVGGDWQGVVRAHVAGGGQRVGRVRGAACRRGGGACSAGRGGGVGVGCRVAAEERGQPDGSGCQHEPARGRGVGVAGRDERTAGLDAAGPQVEFSWRDGRECSAQRSGAPGGVAGAVAGPPAPLAHTMNKKHKRPTLAPLPACPTPFPSPRGVRLPLCRMNNLEDKGLEALAPALEKLPYITRLDLSSNSLSVGAGSTLSKVLEKLLELRELDLDINKLGDEGLEAMAPSLARLRSMTRLGLSSNSLNPTAGTTLGEALQHMDELRELRLGMNALEDKGLEALAPALKKLRYMTRLDLSSNSLRGDARKTLGLALEHLGELRELYLGVWEPPGATAWSDQLDAAYQCYNTAAQSPAFSAALASLSKLEVLHLSGNLISTHGMEELASAVKDLPLTDVDLRSNDLGLNAVDALSGLAANNDRIQRLRLGIVVCSAGRQHRNLLDTMCLNRLAAPGVCPSGLTVLDLSFCSFGSVAGELLALLIEKSTALTDVNLRGNSLTREGVVKLARALEQLVSMTALDMSGTRLKDGGTAVVAGALVRMEKMTSLDLR
mmetsp:Transcript_4289/g.12489  ORF Transcript_4289/g.12489 Transcript_4289/m.12489 type:complete len:563 (+) Transcript_4289:7298-8986(+)